MEDKINIIKLSKQLLLNNIDFFIKLGKDIIPRELQYWDKEHYLLEVDGKWDYSFCCILEEKLMGFLICTKKSEKNFVHINKMAISKEYRSLKIGSKMLASLKNTCLNNNIDAISLFTNKKNEGALNFYLKHGFQIEDIIKDETTERYYMIHKIKV